MMVILMGPGSGMVVIQLYTTLQLKERLYKEFGDGKVSANVERILRQHLDNPAAEKKLRMRELQAEIKRFNADMGENAELIFPQKESPPLPPPQENPLVKAAGLKIGEQHE